MSWSVHNVLSEYKPRSTRDPQEGLNSRGPGEDADERGVAGGEARDEGRSEREGIRPQGESTVAVSRVRFGGEIVRRRSVGTTVWSTLAVVVMAEKRDQ